jgi:oligopeptide/dipeptide ABC transporter ATP-binding protein
MTTVLQVQDLRVSYGTGRATFDAVSHVDLELAAAQTHGLVGESGSGKSTLGRALVGLGNPAGRVILEGRRLDLGRREDRRRLRQRVQMVFQQPIRSFNPRMTMADSISDVIRASRRRVANGGPEPYSVSEALDLVNLSGELADRYPFELSGGQLQRAAIARALATKPAVLIADEITSAIDVSVQAKVMNTLKDLQAHLGFAMLFISHNLAVVHYISHTVSVMYLGEVVERGGAQSLLSNPRHPYTKSLLASMPGEASDEELETVRSRLGAEPDDIAHPPAGCRFHLRCPYGPAWIEGRDICGSAHPTLTTAGVACHFPLSAPLAARPRPTAAAHITSGTEG